MHFDKPELLDAVVTRICEGKSVLVDALAYRGNGKYDRSRDRYHFKVISPIACRDTFYSTDLYKKAEHAMEGKFGVYTYTRQLVIKVICYFDPEFSAEKLDHGYKEGKYGLYKIKVVEE
jgi:hypothetical protein